LSFLTGKAKKSFLLDFAIILNQIINCNRSGGLARSGEAVTATRRKSADTGSGVTGLKALGVRELTYRTVFIASNVVSDELHEAASSASCGFVLRPEDMLGGAGGGSSSEYSSAQRVAMSFTPAERDEIR